MKVLVATDDTTFNVGLSGEYIRRGFDVHVGTVNLFLQQQNFDLIHCHWPEELVFWQVPPDPDRACRTIACLDWWRERAIMLCSVHNVLPHAAAAEDAVTYQYYKDFMLRMHHIGHFSQTSLAQATAKFPTVPIERHFVHGLNLFPDIARRSRGRAAQRLHFGLERDEFVIGTFGQLRTFAEVDLIQAALDNVHAPKPIVLFASRLPHDWPRLRQLNFNNWLRRHNVRLLSGYLDDAQVAGFFEAIDALIIPRFPKHLNSGLLPLAMSFGTPVAAPNYGIYTEILADSGNVLYEAGDSTSLASAIEQLSTRPLAAVRNENLELSAKWGWPAIIDRVLVAIKQFPGNEASVT